MPLGIGDGRWAAQVFPGVLGGVAEGIEGFQQHPAMGFMEGPPGGAIGQGSGVYPEAVGRIGSLSAAAFRVGLGNQAGEFVVFEADFADEIGRRGQPQADRLPAAVIGDAVNSAVEVAAGGDLTVFVPGPADGGGMVGIAEVFDRAAVGGNRRGLFDYVLPPVAEYAIFSILHHEIGFRPVIARKLIRCFRNEISFDLHEESLLHLRTAKFVKCENAVRPVVGILPPQGDTFHMNIKGFCRRTQKFTLVIQSIVIRRVNVRTSDIPNLLVRFTIDIGCKREQPLRVLMDQPPNSAISAESFQVTSVVFMEIQPWLETRISLILDNRICSLCRNAGASFQGFQKPLCPFTQHI